MPSKGLSLGENQEKGIMVKKNTLLYGVRGSPEMGREAETVQLRELRLDVFWGTVVQGAGQTVYQGRRRWREKTPEKSGLSGLVDKQQKEEI